MSTMTDKQAYAAMFHFLEHVYKRTRSDELGGLLGSMSMLEDGSPADPAIAGDWQQAVEYALIPGALSPRQKLLDWPVVGGSRVSVADRDPKKLEELFAGRWTGARDDGWSFERIW